MANFKHKVFLLIAKWIPVAVAAGILINNTLAMLDVKDVILDLFDITVGSSLAFVIMMYACSYVFNFCYWHKIVITYDLFVLSYILLIRYTNIGECSDGLLLTIHYILAGIFIALIWYVIQIDTQLKQLVQEALINSVKGVIEQSQVGKDLLTQQLNYIKSSKNAIIAESNKKLELFEKFQIAASANPNLTYKEFCESINK